MTRASAAQDGPAGPPGDPGSREAKPAPGQPPEAGPARERILDVALGLFIEKGFDGTSLREIAGKPGFTKAALCCHYASKDNILMALHMRLHDVGRDGLKQLADGPVSLPARESLADTVLGQMLAQRKLFLMHERNQAAPESCIARITTPNTTTSSRDSVRSWPAPPSHFATGSGWPARRRHILRALHGR